MTLSGYFMSNSVFVPNFVLFRFIRSVVKRYILQHKCVWRS